MDHRLPQPGTQRSLPPTRSVSGSLVQLAQPRTRPTLPSHLTTVRSVSQPANVVDLTLDVTRTVAGNAVAFLNNKDEVWASPTAIEAEDGDDEPPAKRTKIEGDSFRAGDSSAIREEDVSDKSQQTAPGLPLPTLPKANTSKAKVDIFASRRYRINNPARRANGNEPPSIATRLPLPKRVADFSPWTGKHAEDVLSEAVIKAGYFDKGSAANQNEFNSAKATIWPNLSQKNNMGLQTLSYLFAQVMEKRQALGKCTAPSTFKPPPRVTVTDTKREAWLRDLANPDVPLRKQSRTIPHGIRGKLLMDQCLGKNVPLQRAVWLAKCVGANELRAFRRKGVSGSSAASGESKWLRDWTVGVEQFVEGVIATCGQPDWQKRINYAIKLATSFYVESLLDGSHYLDWIVSSFAAASLDSLPVWIVLIQVYWKDVTKYDRRARWLAESTLERMHFISESGVTVNTTLQLRLQKMITVLARTNRGSLIMARTWEKFRHLLPPTTNGAADDVEEDVAASIFMRNERLAAPLRKSPADTRCALLDLYTELDAVGLEVNLPALTKRCNSAMDDVPSLVAALLRWAASPYRQGLARVYVAAGIISQLREAGSDTDSAVLQLLSSTIESESIQASNLFKVIVELVRRSSFSTGRYMQWLITSGMLSGDGNNPLATGLLTALHSDLLCPNLNRIRMTLLTRVGVRKDVVIDRAPKTVDLSMRSQGDAFSVTRDRLQSLGDMPSLAETLAIAAKTDDVALLATIADTVTLNAESLAVLGQSHPLMEQVSDRYRSLRSLQSLDRTFILALKRLAKRLSSWTALVELLENDLIVCEQQNSMVVCSPASDSLVGMQASNLDSDEDIDAVFASGNSMDDRLMRRIFVRITQRAPKPLVAGAASVSNVCRWLTQLHAVCGPSFDQLCVAHVQNWVDDMQHQSTTTTRSIVALIISECVEVEQVLQVAASSASSEAATMALKLLLTQDLVSDGFHANEQYRFKVLQTRYRDEHHFVVCGFLCKACEDPQFDVEDGRVTELLVHYISSMPDSAEVALKQTCTSEASLSSAGRLCIAVAKRGLHGMMTGEQLDPATIVRLADPLSIRFCVAALAVFTKSDGYHAYGGDERMQTLLKKAIDGGNAVWAQLTEALQPTVKNALHAWAQDALLCAQGKEQAPDPADVSRYLDVFDITNTAARHEDNTASINLLAERLKDLQKRVAQSDDNVSVERHALESLDMLLHLCVFHVQVNPIDNDASQQARCLLLAALCVLLTQPRIQIRRSICEQLQDLASTLADHLPESAVATVAQLLPIASPPDARLTSILGNTPDTSVAWLALASQVQASGPPQQRGVQKQHSQGSRAGATSHASQQVPKSQKPWPYFGAARAPADMKLTPFPLRSWEIIPDPTPVLGENDTSLSLGLFGARKV